MNSEKLALRTYTGIVALTKSEHATGKVARMVLWALSTSHTLSKITIT